LRYTSWLKGEVKTRGKDRGKREEEFNKKSFSNPERYGLIKLCKRLLISNFKGSQVVHENGHYFVTVAQTIAYQEGRTCLG
jgi:hypothetical protein